MKKILTNLVLFAALSFAWVPAFAIGFANSNQSTSQTNSISFNYGNAIASGQFIACLFTPNSGISPSPTLVATDTVNSGGWGVTTPVYQSGPTMATALLYKVTNGAGTPTISVTGFSGDAYITCAYYNGFVSGAIIVAADSSTGAITPTQGTTALITGPAFTNTVNNELIVSAAGWFGSNGNCGTVTGSYTNRYSSTGPGGVFLNDVVKATPAALAFGCTASSAGAWGAMVIAVQDGTGATCTHTGLTSAGASATPNGTTGNYVGKTGAFVTPNCSSIPFWQPAVGNFGTN